METLKTQLGRLWIASRPLTAAGIGMLVVFVLSLAGLAFEPAVITGAPAWLKPAKFAISTAIYALTFAWIFTQLPGWPRLKRIVGWTSAVVFVIEVGIIDAQAARGVTSHFNVGTPLDAALFGIMGAAILVAWAVSIALTVAAFRQTFADETMGWAIRLGLLITVLGSATGGLMTRPTSAQLAAARAGEHVTVFGGHTVGAPDGGPGVPGTGWSTQHGDVRVGHFVGLHGMQAIPLLLWLFRTMRPRGSHRALAFVAAASYASLFVILLWEALRGVPFVAPDTASITALASWLGATAVAAGLAWSASRPGTMRAPRINAMVSL